MAYITFACGTPHGGAVDSTVSLADRAAAAGHRVCVVVASGDAYERRPSLTGALVRLERSSARLGGMAWRLHDRFSSGTTLEAGHAATVHRASDVPAAVGRLHQPGGLLVINSVRCVDLRRLLRFAGATGSPSIWYLREASSLAFAAELGPEVGVLLANSQPLAEEAARVARRPCRYVPSVISREGLAEPVARRVMLAVNPVPSHGLDLLWSLARARPDLPFVLQESWPLDDAAVARLRAGSRDVPNVTFRPRTARSEVFRDARVLLAAHTAEAVGLSRPRVALEAQSLGIPMIANDVPGLAAVTASRDLLVPVGGGADAWAATLARLDDDYERYCREARSFADVEMPTADEVWASFVRACGPSFR